MAIFTIAGLVIKEAVRRRTLVGAFLMGLLVLVLSCMISLARIRMQHAVAVGRMDPMRYSITFPIVRSVLMSLCLSSIKTLGALFAALLAGGAVSGEIERGLLAVILAKPVARWKILLGKWIGLNAILVGSVLAWTLMLWASLRIQCPDVNWTPVLRTGPILALFPIVMATLTLTLSAITPRLLGTTIALLMLAIAWFDGIFNALANTFDVDILATVAKALGLIVPQGYIGWWVDDTIKEIYVHPNRGNAGVSPRFLTEWGSHHLHFARLDAVYVLVYIVVVFLVGVVCFQRRDAA